MKRNLEIVSTEKDKAWVTVYENEKPHINDSQIIQECLIINGRRLTRHNVISSMSIKSLPSG